MLTWSDLEASVDAGLLQRWPFGNGHPPVGGRALYVTPNVFSAMTQRPWPSVAGEYPHRTQQRRTAMRMVIERFVKGDALVAKHDLKELGSEKINARMKGFWEIRSQGPIHETRLLGHFGRVGAFVGTSFLSHEFLNQYSDWEAQRDFCASEWARIFGNKLPLSHPWPVLTIANHKTYTDDPHD